MLRQSDIFYSDTSVHLKLLKSYGPTLDPILACLGTTPYPIL